MKVSKQIVTDVLVIGGGAAGMRAALAAAEAGSAVLLVNKGPVARSGITLTAAGGMQAPFHPDDSPELFFQDTVKFGYELGDQNLIKVLAEDACARALDAERFGARIVRDTAGNFAIGRFPGQCRPRNIFFQGGGVGLASALARACRNHPHIELKDDFFVTGLIKGSDGQPAVAGAVGLDLRTGEFTLLKAKAVVLATGGCQWLWEVNDCPTDATGDGIIYAYRAGGELVDMEMVLFYPSVIVWPPSLKGAFVHYEFLDAAILDGNVYDKDGNAVLPKPLPVRDEAMRLMALAIREGRGTARGGLLWYVGDSPKGEEAVRKRLSTAQYQYLQAHGVDPAKEKVEVAPGAHYLMGGIFIDEQCRTTIAGLFATPECAGNFDGANRLAGSGLTATQVFGAKAGEAAHAWAAAMEGVDVDPASLEAETARVACRIGACSPQSRIADLRDRLRHAVQQYAGVAREAAGLKRLLSVVDEVEDELAQVRVPDIVVFNQPLMDVLQLANMCEIARLVAGSALMREESRGHHFRSDFPRQDDANWLKHTVAVKGETGPRFGVRPVIRL
ncbi:Succinate dehydrogenase [Thermosinus carboxydivorans Nor1]|uniref:Succinate dehydrogenase n=1 Tax=Thermosinus carboxydivorans Nor1 TaxID=401526 RepID=A1HQB6_9FIRM|nr:FAD-binding protein [Thermosinus carboxydivorans]EAX47723.1 Succinate dehydrogenase [Thermosinus carboxydivorans Nor1]